MWNGVLYLVLLKLFLRMPGFTQQADYFFSFIMIAVVWKSLSVKQRFFFVIVVVVVKESPKDFFPDQVHLKL